MTIWPPCISLYGGVGESDRERDGERERGRKRKREERCHSEAVVEQGCVAKPSYLLSLMQKALHRIRIQSLHLCASSPSSASSELEDQGLRIEIGRSRWKDG
jgi:hypothetical protein